MSPVFTRVSLLTAYALAGALVGLVVIHPAVLAIVWLEYSALVPGAPGLAEFLTDRLLLLVVPRHLHMAIAFSVIGALVGLGFGFFTRAYLDLSRGIRFFREVHGEEIPALIRGGETANVEFKSTMRWDMNEKRVNKALETVIGKTIAGFFNARGGRLLIGVADDGTVLGLDADYATLRHPNRDGFERNIADIVTRLLGGDLCPALQTTFASIDGRDVCMVLVQPAPRAVYLNEGGKTHFYVRGGNSTRQLELREAIDYARSRWP